MSQGRLLGHRYRFTAEGSTMRWACERGCDVQDVGRRPLLSRLPLWPARRMGRRD